MRLFDKDSLFALKVDSLLLMKVGRFFLVFGFLKIKSHFYRFGALFIMTTLFTDSGAFLRSWWCFLWPRANFIKIKVELFYDRHKFFAITTIFSLSRGAFYDIGGLLSKSW